MKMFENEYKSVDFKHKAIIDKLGWGEPPQYHSSCSCGWIGVEIDTFPNEETNFLPALKPLIAKYGIEQIVRGPNDSSGTKEDAVKQVLIHINYDPELDAKKTLNNFNELFTQYTKYINEGNFGQSFELVNNLQKAHKEILRMEERINIFENYELNIPAFNPALYKEVQEIVNEYRKSKNK